MCHSVYDEKLKLLAWAIRLNFSDQVTNGDLWFILPPWLLIKHGKHRVVLCHSLCLTCHRFWNAGKVTNRTNNDVTHNNALLCRESKSGAVQRNWIHCCTKWPMISLKRLVNQQTFTDDHITWYNDGVKIGLLSQYMLHYNIEIGIINCNKSSIVLTYC